MNLFKKLETWEKNGLITAAQKEAISDYEQLNRKPKGVWAVLIISALFNGTGLISLIAANWGNIPGSVKIGADWLILAASAAAVLYSFQTNKSTAKEFWLVFYALVILGSIGLTAQVFQLQSEDLRGWFIWSLLLISLLPWSQKPILAMVWVPVFGYTGFGLLTEQEWFQDFGNWVEKAFPGAFLVMTLTVGAVVYSGLKSGLQNHKPQIVRAWGFWLAVLAAGGVTLADLLSQPNLWFSTPPLFDQFNPAGAAAIMLLVAGLVGLEQKLNSGKVFGLVIALLTFFLGLSSFLPDKPTAYQLWGAFLTLSALAAVMLYACRQGNPKLLNWAAGLAILRIFIIYLQVFGSLLLTGLGLIGSGLVLLGLLWSWNRLRHRFLIRKSGGLQCQNVN